MVYYNYDIYLINPLTSPGEGVTVFSSPYLSAGAPALGEAKGLIPPFKFLKKNCFSKGDYREVYSNLILFN